VAMAQLGGAQREPSMEEILASIRRIIEDSDPVRRSDIAGQPVRPDNDTVSLPLPKSISEASVIAVDSFRAGPRFDETAVQGREPPRMADSPTTAAAERASARLAAERAAAPVGEAAATPNVAAPQSPAVAPRDAIEQGDTSSADDWRLGVSEPEFVETSESLDIDMDEVANAVLRDITSAQSVATEISQPEPAASPEPKQETAIVAGPGDMVRPSIVSDQTGRQVAASFSELSEVLAARNRKNLDEMAEEMLRPMLQDWLDNNLPTLVERLVREEIERIARGAAA
jgi:uncharacterized protein